MREHGRRKEVMDIMSRKDVCSVDFPILGDIREQNSITSSCGESDQNDPPSTVTEKSRSCMKCVTVEPAVIGTMFILGLYSILLRQYLFQRLASDHHLDLNRTTKPSCGAENQSDPYYILEQDVSSKTASWSLYLLIATFIPELISDVILGSWGDRVGRKPPIVISLFGFIILTSCYVVVITFNLPLPFLFIGHILTGVLGDFGNLVGCSFSYISDITSPEERTLRMAILETGIGIGGFVASMTSGLWNLKKGFQMPFFFMLGLAIFNFVYTICLLPPNDAGKMAASLKHLFSKEPFVHMYNVMRPRQDNRHIVLTIFAICFCIVITAGTGVRELTIVYTIGVPFCWSFLFVGIISAMGQVCYFVSLIILKIFTDSFLQPKLVILSAVTTIVSSFLFAFAKTTWMLFLGQVFLLLANIPSPIMRSQASQVVSGDEVGSVFAILACAMAIGQTIGTAAYQGIYAVTVDSRFPGSAFLITAGLFLLFIPLYWFGYRISGLKEISKKKFHILTEEEQ